MPTSVTIYRARLEAAETAYDDMMTTGRGVTEYTEPSTGLRVRKDPAAMREYIEYLTQRVSSAAAVGSGSSSARTLVSFARPR